MQKIYKVIITLILIALLINVLPFKLFADSPYVLVNRDVSCNNNSNPCNAYKSDYVLNSIKVGNQNTIAFFDIGNSSYPSTPDQVRASSFIGHLPVSGGTRSQLYYVITWRDIDGSYLYGTWSFWYDTQVSVIHTTYTDDNDVIYHFVYQSTGEVNYNTTNTTIPNIIYLDIGNNPVGRQLYNEIWDSSVQPASFGDLKIGFESSIAYSGGNQNAWRQNKDTIYFDQYDTLGNDLFGYLIELQAIPYSVEGVSQQNIFAKGINDYVFDTVKIGHLGYWSPGQRSIDFTWEYVTNRFSPTWWGTTYDNWSLYGWFQNEHWYRVGWAYRARLVDEDDNVLIDWQWIYNGTSIDGEDVNNIINNNGLTPELVHSINNINNNNNTTNNNYYNNQVINYNSSDPSTDGSWIEQLISSILQTLGDFIGKILDFFSSIFDGLIDLILGLFGDINPAESFFNWFSNLFNGIGDIDLTLPEFNLPNNDLSSFNRLVQETLNIFSFNNFGFVIFIPLLLIIIKAVF